MSILQSQASGVTIQEINLTQVITGASSAVAAQCLVSNQGSTIPKLFTNAQDYLREYGLPNAQISFDLYCGLDFFKQGNQLWGSRVVGAGALYSGIALYTDNINTVLAPSVEGVIDPSNPDWTDILPAGTFNPIALFYPIHGQGSYGNNIALDITSVNVTTPTNFAVVSSNTGGTLAPSTYQYQVSAVGAAGETLATTAAIVVIAGVGVTNSVLLSWNPVALAVGYNIYGRTASTVGLIATVGQGTNTFTDTGGLSVGTQLPITSAANLPPQSPLFTLHVYDLTVSATNPVETFECSLEPYTDGNGVSTELESLVNPFSSYIQVHSNVSALLTVPLVQPAAKVAMNGGTSGTAPTNNQIAAAWSTTFANKQLYPITLLINGGKSTPVVQRAIDGLAQSRGDCIGLLDVPSASQQAQQAVNYRNLSLNINSSYSGLFSPDLLENDTINGKQQYVPFSGTAAALCAYTDNVANPSYSIAGLNRGLLNVLGTRYVYDAGEMTALYNAQVNYTQTFIGAGTALWEQQTLANEKSALSWLSVRRIVNVMKTAIYSFLIYSVQEPDNDFTGRQIVSACSQYLQAVQNAGGISSFKVVSDSTNNSIAMRNSAIRQVTIIIVPTLPIHEINLSLVISPAGVSFSETLTSLTNAPSTN